MPLPAVCCVGRECHASGVVGYSRGPDPDRLRQVRQEQRQALLIADKKIQLVTEAHDAVERQIERLDAALGQLQEANGGEQLGSSFGASYGGCSDVGQANGRRRTGSAGTSGAGAAGSMSTNGVSSEQLSVGALLEPEPEETFCTCGRISFGEMVCCDNPACAIEWFHFGCVGLKESPPGAWLCPICQLLQVSSVKAIKRTAMREEADAKAAAASAGLNGFGASASSPGSPGRGRGRGRGRGGSGGSGGSGSPPASSPVGPSSPGSGRGRGGRGGGRGRGSRGGSKAGGATISQVAQTIFPGAQVNGRKGKHPVKDCPACRGKHKAHTCGRGRNAQLAKMAADE